jgi:alkyldihydroxyacetonephosphate synthase
MDIENLRWWGWGTLDQTYSLEGRTNFWPSLKSWLQLPQDLQAQAPVDLEDVDLRPCRLDDPVLAYLERLVGTDAMRTDKRARVEHAFGKAYRDLVRARTGVFPNPPDAVVYPGDEGQVAALLTWAADRDIAVVPFGGGSTVLGAVEPEPGDRRSITMDTARLDRLVSIDPVSRTARIQAGATGPEVEAQLGERGFTLGHFPQSFEFSTLGGWIATRAAGQTSTGYGKIEHMTQAVRLVTPVGIVETTDTPASATGPSLLQVLVGSEGAYGVVTEATMRIHPCPEVQDYRGYLFSTFENGVSTMRALMQSDLCPTIARLSDQEETTAFSVLAHEHQGLRVLVDQALKAYLAQRGHSLADGSCLMVLGFDGRKERVKDLWKQAGLICRSHGGQGLGRAAGQSWKRDRFATPYLRDTLLGVGVMVDTLETATSWSRLLDLYEAINSSLNVAIRETGGGPGYVMTHVSHMYEWGASLYTTFLGRQVPGQEVEQWWAIKQAVTEAILAAGGTLSHHHGIGRDHVLWLEQEIGRVGVRALKSLKDVLDPAGIMNPGVLLSS